MVPRLIEKQIKEILDEGEFVVVLYGPRQVGKTVLLETLKERVNGEVLMLYGDVARTREVFSSQDPSLIRSYIGEDKLVFIDEAQRIENIGINLKIVKDQMPDIKIIATGSSSFDLANKINEPLTGRKKVFMLYPVSSLEYIETFGRVQMDHDLETLLRFGMYPKVVTTKDEKGKVSYLQEVVEANLYKDILELENIRNPGLLSKLLTLLAFQIGKEVSLSELSNSLDVAIETVRRYLDLLEKAFIIIKVGGFSRNLRKEVTKTSRYYFVDLGVRNTIIRNYNELSIRDDVGMLWENFLVMERLKKQLYTGIPVNNYFWRTYDQKEVDLVEERGGKLFGYEFKWNKQRAKKISAPKDFIKSYDAEFEVISRGNYLDFVL